MQRRGGAGLEVLRQLRQQARVGRAAAALALAAAIPALFLPLLTEVARHKPFWLDEGFEIGEACGASYLSLVARGAPGQTSPAPLYFLVQRLSVRSLDRFDRRITVGYRRVSLAAAGLLLFFIGGALHVRLGPPWALAATASLASQPFFINYAAENRPYMSWLLLFALTVLVAAEVGSRPWREVGRGRRLALAASGVALSLVALPGAFQAGLSFVLCALSWFRRAAERTEARSALRWSLILAAVCVTAGLYFASRSVCPCDGGHLALRWPERSALVRPVLSLIWGDGIAGQIGNALFLVGLVGPMLLRNPRPEGRPFALWLAVGVAAQLALTLLLAAQVVLLRYYFIPRIFLHLVICRALLVALGGWSVVAWLEERATSPGRVALQTVASGLAVLAIAAAFLAEKQEVEDRRAAVPSPASGPCTSGDGTLVVDVPAGGKDWALGPNFIVRLDEERRRCLWRPSAETRHVLALSDHAPAGWFRISAAQLPGAVPLEQCGRPVVLGP